MAVQQQVGELPGIKSLMAAPSPEHPAMNADHHRSRRHRRGHGSGNVTPGHLAIQAERGTPGHQVGDLGGRPHRVDLWILHPLPATAFDHHLQIGRRVGLVGVEHAIEKVAVHMDEAFQQFIHLPDSPDPSGASMADHASVMASKLLVRFAVHWSPASIHPVRMRTVVHHHSRYPGLLQDVQSLRQLRQGALSSHHDDAIHLVLEQELDLPGLDLRIMPGMAKQDTVVRFARLHLDPVGKVGNEAAGPGWQNHADRLGTSPMQAPAR